MQKMISIFKESAKELKNVQVLTIASLLTAMNSILGLFSIVIGDFIRISFSFLAMALAGMLYGPVVSGILGGLGDLINYMLRPTGPYFPGFTFNAVLSGVIYGLCLYQKPISLKRIFAAKLIIVIIVDLILTTTWLCILYGQGFMVLLPLRALKAVIMLPVETAMLYFVASRVTSILGIKNTRLTKN